MRILNIGPGEALASVAQKCNSNFKTLSYELTQLMRRMGRDERAAIDEDMDQRIDRLITRDVPDEVASQITMLDVPSMVSGEVTSQLSAADLPGMVAGEVTSQLDAMDIQGMIAGACEPPFGQLVMSLTDPADLYPETLWVQVDSVTTDLGSTIPIWTRTLA